MTQSLQNHLCRVPTNSLDQRGLYAMSSGGENGPGTGAVAAPTHLRALDVVVQVVPERVDQVDGVVSRTGVGVAREQHWVGHRQGVKV